MRVLLSAEGTRGDVHPLLAFGEACRSEGHDVALCAPDHFRDAARARGFAFRSSGTDVVGYLEEHAAACVRGGWRLARAQRDYTELLVGGVFDAVCEAARGADVVVAAGVQVAAPTAAELHGVPYRYVAYCPALLPSREHGPAILPSQKLPQHFNRFAWRVLVPLLFRPVLARINRRRRELGLSPASGALGYAFGPAPVVLAADPELAPAPPDCPFPVDAVGALQRDDEGPLPEKLEAFLDTGAPPVYVGFGSMTDPDPAGTTRIVLDAVERAGCRALLSHGWARLGTDGLPESVQPVGDVSHARLFARVAAVVHHGGAGTTTTAARAGAPQIVVPHLLDQFYWARRVERLGLGPPAIARRRLDARALARALDAVLDNEILVERTCELGARLRAADPLQGDRAGALIARVLGR